MPLAGNLTITHTPERDACSYAYFAPYTLDRHNALIGRMQCRPGVALSVIGHTADGRDLEMLRIGEPAEGKKKVWFIARQHPGESMAEWFMEGAPCCSCVAICCQ